MMGRDGEVVSKNRYVYVMNNPLKYVDPSGEEEETVYITLDEEPTMQIAAWNPERFVQNLERAQETVETIGDFLTFGFFSQTFDSVESTSQELGRKIGEGTAEAKDFGKVGWEVLSGAGKTALGAFATGATLGETKILLNPLIPGNKPPPATPIKTPLPSTHPSTPIGHKGQILQVKPGTNSPMIIHNRVFSGHALDRMQGQGIPSSVVNATIKPTNAIPGKMPNTTLYYDKNNNISVIVDSKSGNIITVDRGLIKQQ